MKKKSKFCLNLDSGTDLEDTQNTIENETSKIDSKSKDENKTDETGEIF